MSSTHLKRYRNILDRKAWKVFLKTIDHLSADSHLSDQHLPLVLQTGLAAAGSPFKEAPVDILQFAARFGFRPYPRAAERLTAFEKKLRDDPQYQDVTEFIEADGKGSGKDFRASIKAAYLLYWLECLRDPQSYYRLAPDENIDLVVVAETASQARNVTFAKLIERLHTIHATLWVGRPDEEQTDRRRSGAPAFDTFNSGWFAYHLGSMQIRLPHNITLHVAHGDIDLATEAGAADIGKSVFDGLNVLCSLFTEPSAMRISHANALARTFESSGKTRFGSRFSQHYMSYVRDAASNDFIAMKLQQAARPENHVHMRAFCNSSWEVNEAIAEDPRTGKKIMERFMCPEYGEKLVPRALLPEYYSDPVGAAMKYEGLPPAAGLGLFPWPDRLQEAAHDHPSPVTFRQFHLSRSLPSGSRRNYTALQILQPPLPMAWFEEPGAFSKARADIDPVDRRPRVIALDPGLNHDAYALASGYCADDPAAEAGFGLITVDLVAAWQPDKSRPVDYTNVSLILDLLLHLFPGTRRVIFDRWNSQADVDRLIARGIDAESIPWTAAQQDAGYRLLVESINAGLFTFPRSALADLASLRRDGLRIVSSIGQKHIPDVLVHCCTALRSSEFFGAENRETGLKNAVDQLKRW